jgi:steroid 5-alpha reductase family enzyme
MKGLGLIKIMFILLFTVVAIPLVTIYIDEPLTALQKETLLQLGYIVAGVVLYCFVVSELSGNNSQVDKLWSIVPIGYVWFMAYKGGFDSRLVLMACLATAWGIRLTLNFARRDAYSWKFWQGEEDYRWAILRENPALKGKVRWTLFSFFFICLYQNLVVAAFTLPMIVLFKYLGQPIGIWEIVLAVVFMALLVIETVADQQQWDFHKEKNRLKKEGKPLTGEYAEGFVQSGLWAKVRHPNYAAEQSIWVVFYLFSLVASGYGINWSMAGCLLLIILFQGSADFSEGISAGKYPGYKAYQKRVGRFLPRLF